MKKYLFLALGLFVAFALTLSACSLLACHRCGDSVGSDPVKAGGRIYCSYDCYMDEVLFD